MRPSKPPPRSIEPRPSVDHGRRRIGYTTWKPDMVEMLAKATLHMARDAGERAQKKRQVVPERPRVDMVELAKKTGRPFRVIQTGNPNWPIKIEFEDDK